MTTMINRKQTMRFLLLVFIVISMTLLLFVGTAACHIPPFPQTAFAHAMGTGQGSVQAQLRCASNPSAQTCTNQDPMVQGCDNDAVTVAFKTILDAQGNLLATVERRYSPTCHSEWGRITDNGRQPLLIVVNTSIRSTRGNRAFSAMVFVPNLGVAPEIDGTVSLNGIDPAQGGGVGREAILPALPPAQN